MQVLYSLMPYDVIVLGAGGAGLMCALTAAKRGRKVAVLDHSEKIGGKIIISGGGRCNFTNLEASAQNFVSQNAHFAKSALSRYQPGDFTELLDKHRIAYHEKKLGQLFCDGSAQQVVDMFSAECAESGVEIFLEHKITAAQKSKEGFSVETDKKTFTAKALVVATGGLSYPKFCATPIGYDIAKAFDLKITDLAPALDGFVFNDFDHERYKDLPGLALDVKITTNGVSFNESLLFTHVGLSGPAALQASLHWRKDAVVRINLVPSKNPEELFAWFQAIRGDKKEIIKQMGALLPKRLAECLGNIYLPAKGDMGNFPKKDLEAMCAKLQDWQFVPKGTVGYGKAEVTRGGIDTHQLSSKTMEVRKIPGLFFIGEIVDVTGWLGGFNYQWAWASGRAAGEAV
jgi:predicted Rossmann fold flavoprotein